MSFTKKNIILTTQDLSIGYQKKDTDLIIANNLNLKLQEGKLVAILGKNGSGKSTLLRTITLMQPSLDGNVLLHQKNINSYKREILSREISVVLTEKLPENLLTVYELIAMGRQTYTNWFDQITKVDKEKIDYAIALTNVNSLLKKKFSQLSDGQQQKVLIAKSIAQDTAIIFLDEPTTHLDVHHRMETFLILKNLAHKHNKCIVMATHEVGLSVEMADELWLFNNKSISVGSPKELIKNNSISQVFDSDLIHFNAEKTTFEYK